MRAVVTLQHHGDEGRGNDHPNKGQARRQRGARFQVASACLLIVRIVRQRHPKVTASFASRVMIANTLFSLPERSMTRG